jgi:phosphatidylethanolamine-binding protein (PEBP) family uncharacterized protein
MGNITKNLFKRLLVVLLVPFIMQCNKNSAESEEEITDLSGVGENVIIVSGDSPADGAATVQVSTTAEGGATTTFSSSKPSGFTITGQTASAEARPTVTWVNSVGSQSYNVKIAAAADCVTEVAGAENVSEINWTVDQDLSTGTYFLCVAAVNQIGSTNASNNGLALVVTIAPGGDPIVTLDTLPTYANLSNYTSFPVSGTCDFESVIVVTGSDYSGNIVTENASCDSTGVGIIGAYSTSLDLSTIDENAFTIGVQNGVSVTGAQSIKDTVAPALVAPSDNLTANNSVVWNWSCTEVLPKVCQFRHLVNGSAATAPSGAYDSIVTFSQLSGDGSYYLHLQATDVAGNPSPVTHTQAVIDNTAPALTIDTPANALPANVGGYTLSGTCDETGTGNVAWSIDDGANPAVTGTSDCTNPAWTATSIDLSSLNEGTLNVTVDLPDEATNSGSASSSFVKDTVVPAVNAPANDANPVKSVTWNWSCDDAPCTFRHLVDTNSTGDPTGSYNATVSNTLSAGTGTYYIHIQALDSSGNISPTTHSLAELDNTDPTLTVTASANVLPANVGSYSISGTCSEIASGNVAWSIDDSANPGTAAITGAADCIGGNTWSQSSINLGSLDQGTLTISVSHADLATNSVSLSPTVTKDTILPLIAIVNPQAVNGLNELTYSIGGTCDESGTDNVGWSIDDQNGGIAAVTGTADCDGNNWIENNINLSGIDDDTLDVTANLDDAFANSAIEATASPVKNTIAPALGINALDDANNGNKAAFPISGTCDVNTATVFWEIDDSNGGTAALTGSVTCDGTDWPEVLVDVRSLDDGTLDVKADMDDLSSNAAPTATANAPKDVIDPTVGFDAITVTNSLDDETFAFSGTCDVSGVDVSYSIDDQGAPGTSAILGNVNCDGSNWSVPSLNISSLNDGTLDFTADITDVVGNTATQATGNNTKDTEIPTLSLNAHGMVNDDNRTDFQISGGCNETSGTVDWVVDDQGAPGTAALQGSVTCNGTTWPVVSVDVSTLNDGTLDITIDMKDAAENPATTATSTTPKDILDPSVGIDALGDINDANDSAFSFSGTCDVSGEDVSYSIDDQADAGTSAVAGVTNCDGTNWSVSNLDVSSLNDSTLDFTINFSDVVGNAATTATDSNTKDAGVPTVGLNAILNVNPSNANIATLAISGSCTDDGDTVTVSVDDQGDGGTAAISDTFVCASSAYNVTLNVTSLNDLVLDVTADITDAAGNVATTASSTTNKDTTAPAVPDTFVLNSPASALDNDANPELRFTSLNGDEIIRVYTENTCDTETENATAVSAALNISLTVSGDAVYEFWAASEDAVGNVSACSSTSVVYELDQSINAISSITLISPSSPGNVATPIFRIGGVESGDTVKIYSSGSCFANEQMGFAVSTGTTVDVQVDPGEIVTQTNYTIYGRSNDSAGNFSNCTAISENYLFDQTPPAAPTAVLVTNPAAPDDPNTDTQPTVLTSGVTNGYGVNLYSNSDCSTEIAGGTSSGTTLSMDTNVLSVDGVYTIYATQTDLAGNESACSSVFENYNLDINDPVLTTVTIESGGGANVTAVDGEAYLVFIASEPLATNTATIHGKAATITNLTGLTYRAVYQFIGADSSVDPVPFTIDFTDQAGRVGTQVTAITGGTSLEFVNSDWAPSFDVSSQAGSENSLYTLDVNDVNSGNDLDNDGTAITYSCYYDTTVDGIVSTAQACSALTGSAIVSGTGVLSWTPSYTEEGVYELRVIGHDGTNYGEDIFALTISNTNRLPVLASISNQDFILADTFQFDMSDTNTGNDTDVDGETIVYSCVYDTVKDLDVTATTDCADLDGVDFAPSSGYLNWTVQPTTPGDFEFKIIGNDGTADGVTYFWSTVTIDISKLPQLNMVGSNTTAYIASLSANNEVTFKGLPIGGGGTPTIYGIGDTFTVSASVGDKLECSGGCYAITDTDGTAAWSTQTYSSTLLATFVGRNNDAKIVVAAFDQAANITIYQSSGIIATGSVAAESVVEFSDLTVTNEKVDGDGALWIQSDAPVSAYFSSNTSFNQDGRVITAASQEGLAFISGGGGTPAGIATTVDGTTVSAYQNSGVNNYIDQLIDKDQIVVVTDATQTQNTAASAIAYYADQPVTVTQHADGDGSNATPSLPKSMLSTHFVTPMTGDYAGFISYEPGYVIMIHPTNGFISATQMTRDVSANALAPYAYSYNPATQADLVEGMRFVCTTPCMGVFEPANDANAYIGKDDETLMTGTLKDPMEITSLDFNDGGTIPADFIGNRAAECTGNNDFPDITWANLPWGTEKLVIIVEDDQGTPNVHLNITDISVTTDEPNGSQAKIVASSNVVTFPTGTEGLNSYADGTTSGWSGPCVTSGEYTYTFKVYALNDPIGAAIDDMNQATFEATYSAKILGSASITAKYDSP